MNDKYLFFKITCRNLNLTCNAVDLLLLPAKHRRKIMKLSASYSSSWEQNENTQNLKTALDYITDNKKIYSDTAIKRAQKGFSEYI